MPRLWWSVAGLALVAASVPAFGLEYKSKKSVTKDYKGIHRRGNGGAENERRRLLEAAEQLRDRSDTLGARADALDDQGKDEAADDLRDRADEAAQQAKRLEDRADELRLPSAIKRGAPRHSIESDAGDD
jgi:hypothetical protein